MNIHIQDIYVEMCTQDISQTPLDFDLDDTCQEKDKDKTSILRFKLRLKL